MLELIRSDRNPVSNGAQENSWPDYGKIFARADRSPNRFKTREEVDAYIAGLRSEW